MFLISNSNPSIQNPTTPPKIQLFLDIYQLDIVRLILGLENKP